MTNIALGVILHTKPGICACIMALSGDLQANTPKNGKFLATTIVDNTEFQSHVLQGSTRSTLAWQEETSMRMLLVVAAVVVVLVGIFGSLRGMNPYSMIVAIVAISVFGGVLREFVKNKRDVDGTAQKDLVEIKQRIAQIEADIGDIKEQIADFIIKQV